MYKIIEVPLASGKRSYTIGKINLELKVDDVLIYAYKNKDTKELEINKYKVIAIDNDKKLYKVQMWALGPFYGKEWALNYTKPCLVLYR